MNTIKTAFLLLIIHSPLVLAEDNAAPLLGKALHNEKCTQCHNSEVYSRLDRKINSLDFLKKRVKGCSINAVKEEWSNSQIDSVVSYLNNEYYQF